MRNIKFSVIIIGYNIEKYIKRCLDSVCNQTYNNYEIIFVDDGSKDSTYMLAKEFEERGVKCHTKQNGGIISARKLGIEKSNGDYLIFVDGDDYINEDMLSNFADALEKEVREIDILMTDAWYQIQSKQFLRWKSEVNYGIYEGKTFFENIMLDKMFHHMFPKAYKKSFVNMCRYNEFPEITVAEDLMTNAVFGLSEPTVLYSKDSVNYKYCYNSDSSTRKENELIFQQEIVLDYIEKRIEEENLFDRYKEYIDYSWLSYAFAYIGTHFSSKFKRRIMKRCRPHLKGFKNNEFCKAAYYNFGKSYRFLFQTYRIAPMFGGASDCIVNVFRTIKKVIKNK